MADHITINGIQVVSSALAMQTERRVDLAHNPRRRRGRWSVRVTVERVPCAYQVRDPFTGQQMLVMHHSLYEKMKEACHG